MIVFTLQCNQDSVFGPCLCIIPNLVIIMYFYYYFFVHLYPMFWIADAITIVALLWWSWRPLQSLLKGINWIYFQYSAIFGAANVSATLVLNLVYIQLCIDLVMVLPYNAISIWLWYDLWFRDIGPCLLIISLLWAYGFFLCLNCVVVCLLFRYADVLKNLLRRFSSLSNPPQLPRKLASLFCLSWKVAVLWHWN